MEELESLDRVVSRHHVDEEECLLVYDVLLSVVVGIMVDLREGIDSVFEGCCAVFKDDAAEGHMNFSRLILARLILLMRFQILSNSLSPSSFFICWMRSP